jgi:hypothetical protein
VTATVAVVARAGQCVVHVILAGLTLELDAAIFTIVSFFLTFGISVVDYTLLEPSCHSWYSW